MHTISEKKLLLLSPSDIRLSQYRARSNLDEYSLFSLASSILANGIITPLTVMRDGKDKYILISGERRLKAAKLAGLRRVPCAVHSIDEKTAAVFSLADNLGRESIDFFEQAKAIEYLMGVYAMSLSEIAQRLGTSQSALLAKLRLLKIPEDKRERILSGKLTEEHALALIDLDKKDMSLVLDAVISERLNVRQTKELVNSVNSPVPETQEDREPPIRKTAIGDVKFFTNSLTKLLITMQNSGVRTSLDRKETDSFVEYKIKIDKSPDRQLSFSGI